MTDEQKNQLYGMLDDHKCGKMEPQAIVAWVCLVVEKKIPNELTKAPKRTKGK